MLVIERKRGLPALLDPAASGSHGESAASATDQQSA
jgi:hypothetical protein